MSFLIPGLPNRSSGKSWILVLLLFVLFFVVLFSVFVVFLFVFFLLRICFFFMMLVCFCRSCMVVSERYGGECEKSYQSHQYVFHLLILVSSFGIVFPSHSPADHPM